MVAAGLWRFDEGLRYVFAGSGGEAFVLADDPLDYNVGYETIEMRGHLDDLPNVVCEDYHHGPWPDTVEVKNWVRAALGTDYPDTAAELMPKYTGDDPFAVWVATNNRN